MGLDHRPRRAPQRRRKLALAIAVAGDLGMLGLLQVHRLPARLGQNLASSVSASTSAPVIYQITLPVGISFFTFQAMSYIIDIYRGSDRADLLARLRRLPVLLPAPGGRPDRARLGVPAPAPRRPDPRRVDASLAFFLIMSGLFKKVVLSDLLSPAHRRPGVRRAVACTPGRRRCWPSTPTPPRSTATSAATPTSRSVSPCCSASGSPRTSTRPYTAVSIQDFWRRWHMTLSRWLRDYLYIPLGGNRRGRLRHLSQPDADDAAGRPLARRRAGRSWSGARGRAASSASTTWRRSEREAQGLPSRCSTGRGPDRLRRLLTFNIVCVGWVFFRADLVPERLGRAQAGSRSTGGSRLRWSTSSVLLARPFAGIGVPVRAGRLDGAATYRICGAFAG